MVTATDPAFSEKPLHDLEVKDDFEHREMTARGTAESTPDTPDTASADLEYKDEDEQPVLHHRTYIALAALFLLNFTQVIALNGPPAVAVGGPVIARKTLLVATCTVSFIGSAIAPGSKDIYRVIVAQILIGVGFAGAPLAYAIPSEILPRKWRPLAQSIMNIAAGLGTAAAPLISGSLTKKSAHSGWRNFYWIQMALWGVTVLGLIFGYRPPKRHTGLDHLSFWQKIGRLDLPGMGLISAGLTLLLVALSLGNNPWPWTSATVLSTLVLGIVFLIGFGVYEWKGTKTGILHHDLFGMRTFGLCILVMFCEGIMVFALILFYPTLTVVLFESDPLLAAVRQMPMWVCGASMTVLYGWWSSKRRTIRAPLMVGFAIFTAAIAALDTLQPNDSTNAIVFNGLAGIGFGAPLILLIVGVQLSTPHHLIATATAVLISSRAVSGTVFMAIYTATVSSAASTKLPKSVATAAIAAGLSPEYATEFVGDMLTSNATALQSIPGVTPAIIKAGTAGLLQGYADSYRLVFIIAAPFGVVACLFIYFIEDVSALMTYRVDAPVEELHARHHAHEEEKA